MLSKVEVAHLLLEIGCLELSPSKPFHYASGLKGPIYCDNRKILSHPAAREKIVDTFLARLSESGWQFDYLAGLATGGIPHAAFMAQKKSLPMVYVRSKPKSHGKRQQVEGDFRPGDNVVLVEDLVNQGSSLDEALLGVQDSELNIVGCLSIVHYQMPKAVEVVKKWELDFHYLTDFDSICSAALERGLVTQEEGELLSQWQSDPKEWSEKYGH